ncbi:hypothetical protein SAMN05446037_100337 [Anaerovirgula multivorans]|uniref:Uncharacterized protein n=1 Tax=Anaerovirgula multivorans TaxID=312168 RepID=A0A239B6Y0_9FIRM|nr:hypothetical protein [Anaerovirgula multivorans]SNS03412.1 hypothetical protein SAMN05446037_100337 [Anaerovirgula multivorans]
MKKILLILLISTLLLFGCSTTISDEKFTYIDMPEEINFYYGGDTMNIGREMDHYRIIYSLINKVVADTVNPGIMKYTERQLNEEDIKMAGYALELIYTDTIKSELMIDGKIQKLSYDRIFIPLDNNIVFLGNDKEYAKKGLSITFIPKEFVASLLNYEEIEINDK